MMLAFFSDQDVPHFKRDSGVRLPLGSPENKRAVPALQSAILPRLSQMPPRGAQWNLFVAIIPSGLNFYPVKFEDHFTGTQGQLSLPCRFWKSYWSAFNWGFNLKSIVPVSPGLLINWVDKWYNNGIIIDHGI